MKFIGAIEIMVISVMVHLVSVNRGFSVWTVIGLGLLSIIFYLFSDVFCIIDDEDGISREHEDTRHFLGTMNIIVSLFFMYLGAGFSQWAIMMGMPILLRQSYEDFLSYKAYELPMFIGACACIINVFTSGGINKMYIVLCLVMIIWGMNKVFGRADMYGYLIILSIGSSNITYMMMCTIMSSVITVIFGFIKCRREKVKLTKVKVALLPIIYVSGVISYAICSIMGLK